MSPNSARARLTSVTKFMTELSYIGRGSKAIRDLTPEELIVWINREFPDGGWDKPTTWNFYVWGIHKLADFLRYEVKTKRGRPVFSKDDHKLIKEEIMLRPVDKDEPPKLSKDFINRYEKFLDWMKGENPHVYAFARWSYLTCMRFSEVAKMDAGLMTGSGIKQADGTLKVEGKRDRGRKAIREVPIGMTAKAHLKWWMGYRKRNHIEHEALFVTARHLIRWVDPTGYNRSLRRLAKRSGMFKGTIDPKTGDHPTGELKLIKSHWMGRHAGATSLGYAGADLKLIKRQTGHKRIDILDGRYINIDSKDVAEQLDSFRNSHGSTSDQVEPGSLKDMIMTAIRELSPEEKKALGMEILKEVMS